MGKDGRRIVQLPGGYGEKRFSKRGVCCGNLQQRRSPYCGDWRQYECMTEKMRLIIERCYIEEEG